MQKMDPPSSPTPTPSPPSSTVTSSSTASSSLSAATNSPFQLLEISLISAQDLSPVTKSMRTYAIAWIHPNRKLTTRTDQHGHTNPTWNEKFEFRLDNESLTSEDTTITVEIYTVSWFRDILVGTVRVLMNDLLSPSARIAKQTRFVALQVRRPSGNPQGILNMGVAIVDSTMRSMPLNNIYVDEENKEKDNNLDNHEDVIVKGPDIPTNGKHHLWRSLSTGFEDITNEDLQVIKPGAMYNNDGSMVNGSICNGSLVNGSELCSDIGPSASIVAAEMAHKSQPPQPTRLVEQKMVNRYKHNNGEDIEETGSSILEDLTMEEAKAKGYRIRTRERMPEKESNNGSASTTTDDESELLDAGGRRGRRNSDGGLFSCFGTAYRIEFRIVCGASKNDHHKSKKGKTRKPTASHANSA